MSKVVSLRPNRNAGVVDSSNSRHTTLRSLPVREVRWNDGFWSPWVNRARDTGVPRLLELLEEYGVLDNFRRLAGKDVERRGFYWTDSDLYKWMEAAAMVFEHHDDEALRQRLEEVIDVVLAAQQPDGYINTFFIDKGKDERFTRMRASHEFYNLGHLMQAAIAYHRSCGDMRLLEAVRRFADYLTTVFGPGKRADKPDHPQLEMALIELYRVTEDKRYLDLAGFLLKQFDHTKWTKIKEHAVCTTYLLAGTADYILERSNKPYRETLERLWADMTRDNIYLTGGIGTRYWYEDFGFPYELPNLYGYAETCAAIGNLFWNWRMLLRTGEPRYADLMETLLYNGILAGVGMGGSEYFYKNPLASTSNYERNEWHECTCCPPNALRLLLSLSGYLATTEKGRGGRFTPRLLDSLRIHFFDNATIRTMLPNGQAVGVTMETRYPWEGKVTFTIDTPGQWILNVRIPGWCTKGTLWINGRESGSIGQQYLVIARNWQAGDQVVFRFDMPAVYIRSHPKLRDNAACAAIRRGPLVYCAESTDNPGVDILATRLDTNREPTVQWNPDLLGGVNTISAEGLTLPWAERGPLYRTLQPGECKRVPLTFIPYYAWANRGKCDMAVWM